MLILNAHDVRLALPMADAIEAIKRAFCALSAGRAEVPPRAHLDVEPHDGVSLVMPAYVSDPRDEALAVKVVSLGRSSTTPTSSRVYTSTRSDRISRKCKKSPPTRSFGPWSWSTAEKRP